MINFNINKKVFNEIYFKNLFNETYTQIYFGGSGSGKSYFLAQRTIIDLISKKRNYLICRKTGNTIRKSIINELLKAISFLKMESFFTINKSDSTITCVNGNQILTAGLDDTEKIKSITPVRGVLTDIWVEEATEADYNDIMQLKKRMRGETEVKKRLTLSFNPIIQSHWIYKEYFTNFNNKELISDDLYILKTTYKDNRFLTQQDIFNLENEKDEYFYNVYTLGNWGVLGKNIFKNYKVEDLNVQYFDNIYHGLDFGFANDPCAFVTVSIDKINKKIYILDEFQELELSNDLLAQKLKNLIGTEYVYCDSVEPKSIKELKTYGINALPAKKGKGSLTFGIDWLKRYEIIINSKCVNFKREIELYRYKERNGIVINVPIDKDNHLIDALRYALEDQMIEEEAILF